MTITAAPLQLAQTYHQCKHNVLDYYQSEKLDGVRAWWDGYHLYTRGGHRILAPTEFTQLPSGVELDGEIYSREVPFDHISGTIRSQGFLPGVKETWSNLQYHVFDSPSCPGTFKRRLGWLRNYFCENPSEKHLVVSQTRYATPSEYDKGFAEIIARGGEGVMLRKADSPYEAARNANLLKRKVMHDLDARVIGHEEGKGKHQGRLGALLCETLETNVKFKVGTGMTDQLRENPPIVGATITVGYQSLTPAGKPRFPVYLREFMNCAPSARSETDDN